MLHYLLIIELCYNNNKYEYNVLFIMHNYDFSIASSEAIEDSLSKQLDSIRLSRNITQSALAKDAGVSRSTITRLAQNGKGISLDSFIRILKALGLEGQLQSLLPIPEQSPLQRLANRPKQRQRARPKSSKRSSVNDQTEVAKTRDWTWAEGSTE